MSEKTMCPICGYDFDRGHGLPDPLPPKCPVCKEDDHLDHLIGDDEDYTWVQ